MRKKIFISSLLLFAFLFISSLKYDLFEISKQLEIYNTVFKNINMNYVEKTDPAKLTKAGVSKILSTLDPYTTYSSEEDIEKAKINSAGGISLLGASFAFIKEELTVTKVYKKSAAATSGLMPGDVIKSVNDINIERSTSDFNVLLLGNKEIKILLTRNGEEKMILLKKSGNRTGAVPVYKILNNKTGYIALSKFTKGCSKEVESALKFLMIDEIETLVLDLRNNPGGLLGEAVEIVNLFVKKDELVVYTKSNVNKYNQEFITRKQPLNTDIPIVVLINEQSASASEIVAGALQDIDRAVIVGKQSFGKGLVQNVVPIPYGGQMKITISKYYTPSGRCIQALDYTSPLESGVVKEFKNKTFFKTKNGRVVYNNAGIVPDVLVGTKSKFDIIKDIKKNNLLFRYAFKYCESNGINSKSDIKITKESFKDFKSFYFSEDPKFKTKTEKAINILKKTSSDEDLLLLHNEIKKLENIVRKEKEKEFEKLESEIIELIENKIFEILFYNDDHYFHTLENDNTIKKAISILSSDEYYYSILK